MPINDFFYVVDTFGPFLVKVITILLITIFVVLVNDVYCTILLVRAFTRCRYLLLASSSCI